MRSSSSDEETARILDDAVYHLDLQRLVYFGNLIVNIN